MEQTNQNQQNQQQTFRCSGDCFSCRAINERKTQWQYCAAQHAYNAMRMIQTMQTSMEAVAGTVEELKAKVNAIQDSEAMVFAPGAESPENAEEIADIAQKGDGAEE